MLRRIIKPAKCELGSCTQGSEAPDSHLAGFITSKSSRPRISYRQLEQLWELLNSHREIATGFNRSKQDRYHARLRWKAVATTLNAHEDGANKDWRGWCKYWVDYKTKLKKLVARVSQQRTAGGPAKIKITELDHKFLHILGENFGSGTRRARVEPLEELQEIQHSYRRVSYRQREHLWELLNSHREIVTGFNKSKQERCHARLMWKAVATTLNAHGDGAYKDWRGWCKFWVVYKNKLKKLAARVSQQRTVGGTAKIKITELDHKFLHILGENVGSGTPGARVEPLEEEIQQVELFGVYLPVDSLPGTGSISFSLPVPTTPPQARPGLESEPDSPPASGDIRTIASPQVHSLSASLPGSPPPAAEGRMQTPQRSPRHRQGAQMATPQNSPGRRRSLDGPTPPSAAGLRRQQQFVACSTCSRRRVSYRQLEHLWELLNSHREIVTGFNKSKQKRCHARLRWKAVATTLNAHEDGAYKDWRGWCKYWVVYKSKLKKLAARVSQQRTVGGSAEIKITELERKFLHILRRKESLRVEPLEEETQQVELFDVYLPVDSLPGTGSISFSLPVPTTPPQARPGLESEPDSPPASGDIRTITSPQVHPVPASLPGSPPPAAEGRMKTLQRSPRHRQDAQMATPQNSPRRRRSLDGPTPPSAAGLRRQQQFFACSKCSRRRVSYRQLKHLWELLNSHRVIVTGFNKSKQKRCHARLRWKAVATTLNAHEDGAYKDWRGWCKYWVDYKSKLKKLVARVSQQRTVGGTTKIKITELDHKFLHILGENVGSGTPGARVEPHEEEIQQVELFDVYLPVDSLPGTGSISFSLPVPTTPPQARPSLESEPDSPPASGDIRTITSPQVHSLSASLPGSPPPAAEGRVQTPQSYPRHRQDAQMATPQNSPRCRRHLDGPTPQSRRQMLRESMSAEASRRALIKVSERRAELEENRNSILDERLKQIYLAVVNNNKGLQELTLAINNLTKTINSRFPEKR